MNTNVEAIKAELKKIELSFKVLKDGIDSAENWNNLTKIVTNIKDIGKFIQDVVIATELVCKDALSDVEDIKGEDKREAAAKFLDEAIKFRGWSAPIELIDEKIFSIALSLTVYFLNERYGHDWNTEKIREALSNGSSFIKELPVGNYIDIDDSDNTSI